MVPEILDQVPAAGIEEDLLVFAEAVKEIEHRVVARFFGVVAGRKKNAVRNAAAENFTGDGATFGAARGVGGSGEEQAAEQKERASKAKRAGETPALQEILLIAQGLDWVQAGRARCGINSGAEAYGDGKGDGRGNHPPGNGGDADPRKRAAAQINIRCQN